MKDDSIYLFCVVVWSVLVNDEFWGQLEKSTHLPSPAVGEALKPVELQLDGLNCFLARFDDKSCCSNLAKNNSNHPAAA